LSVRTALCQVVDLVIYRRVAGDGFEEGGQRHGVSRNLLTVLLTLFSVMYFNTGYADSEIG
jgi:hypothetical protein